jgi:hypothetical protein
MVRKLARECKVTQAEAERGLLELIARGHLRIVPSIGPGARDDFELIIKQSNGAAHE